MPRTYSERPGCPVGVRLGKPRFVELPADRACPDCPAQRAAAPGDNAGMDAGEFVASILDAIGSGRDLYLYDHYVAGPDPRQRAREVLIEKRDACSDPDEVAFLTRVIHGLEKGRG